MAHQPDPGHTNHTDAPLPVDRETLLNALPYGIALLDAQGAIHVLNTAWRTFNQIPVAVANGTAAHQKHVSSVEEIVATSGAYRHTLTEAVRMVLAGERAHATIEHPGGFLSESAECATPSRWYTTTITPYMIGGARGVLLNQHDTTDRKRLEARLNDVETRLQTIFYESPDIILLIDGATGIIRDVNPAVRRMLGYYREELIGQHFSYLLTTEAVVMPEGLIEDIRAHGAVIEALQFRTAHNTMVLMDMTTTIISLGDEISVLVTLRDATQRSQNEREAAAALEQREASYRAMIEQRLNAFFTNAPAGLVLFDDQLRYQKINETAAQMNGLPIADHLGKTIPEVLPDLTSIGPLYDQVVTTGEPVSNIEVSGKTLAQPGVLRHWQVSIFPIPGPGNTLDGVGSIFVEITEVKQARERLQRTNEELERRVMERTAELSQINALLTQEIQERIRIEEALAMQSASLARQVEEQTADLRIANAQLERAARLKDEFLANMSHELRTPLNAILGLSEVLQDEVYGPITEKQQKSVHTIAESGQHLLELINDILDLAKVGAGKIEMDFTNVPVESACQASLRLIKQTAHKKRLIIHEMVDSSIATVRADERRLKQMLVNLLSNAVKFTTEGGQIGLTVTANEEHRVIKFSVWDTGIGIAHDDLKRLFQPFEQVDSSLSRRYEGTGLGLVLVARLAEMHGGSVTAESEVDKGSCFTISLPLHHAIEPSIHPNTPSPVDTSKPQRATSIHLQRAVIIEDSPTAAEQIVRYLSHFNVDTHIVTCGEDALHSVQQTMPDVVILDILLPDISGWQVLQSLQSDEQTQYIPVIVTSVVDERAQGLALGATGYLVKPMSRQQFLTELGTIFPHVLTGIPWTEEDTIPESNASDTLILLAEDNEDNIQMLSEYLVMRGYRVQIAHNGVEAVEKANIHQPALILMDIQMPEMDGLEAIQHIRTNADLAATPIIAVTALAMPGDRERCLAAGANEYLSKPISLRQLRQLIEGYV